MAWTALPLLWILLQGAWSKHWAAWMPQSISAFTETCVAIPCRFDFPSEIQPSAVHGIWYFNSPYPKNFPPVVLKSKTNTAHDIYMGRTKMLGDLKEKNCSIQIDRLSLDLQGKYYFRTDLGGYNQYTFSEHANLHILDEPYVLSPTMIVSASETELTCLVPDNCPDMKPSVTWIEIEGLEHHSAYARLEESDSAWTHISTLKFLPSHKNNGQRLGCKVTYPDTELEYRGYITMDVKYAPRILDINSSSETTEGTQVALVCVVDSNPLSRIMWFKEDVLLKEDYSRNLTLELEHVTFSHDGVYICAAENEHGRANKSMGLAVMYAPWKPLVNASGIAVEGESVTIMCNTQGNPEPTISIIKDKHVLSSVIFENELVLEIPAVSHEHDGEYWCTAENPYGQSNSSFNLTVVCKLVWAKIGPVGAVVVFVILVAVGGYLIKTREKKNLPESSSFVQTDASGSHAGHSSVKKNLGKLENQFLSISERLILKKQQPSSVDSDYANIDFTKKNVKDSYTSTEELTEYAEIRVK
uniref:Myelin associated glycoprotein n=1 Tax=Leptobrachium leishanense TaxID=445787 RepID=A0A8C5Q0S8_9ANUR